MSNVKIIDVGPVRQVVLSRPEKRNALDGETMRDLSDAIHDTAAAAGIRAVIFRGEGQAFCAGVDRNYLGSLLSQPGGVGEVRKNIKLIQGMWNAIEAMPKVTIAQVHGMALGGGMEFALACDLRTMAEDASVALISARLGFLPETGGCSRLAPLVGVGIAKDLIFTGRPVGADEALRMGLANRIAPAEELDAVTQQLARDVLSSAPLGLAAAKRIIDTGAKPLLATTLEMEMEATLRLFSSEDAAEAARAFAERRPPEFVGR